MAKKSKKDSVDITAKPKLDLIKTLEAFDKRDFEYYNNLPEELKKQFVPFVLMRFMSVAANQGGLHEYHLQVVNHFVNRDFWTLSKHPELLYKLLCLCGTGTKQYHKWIPENNKKSVLWLELFKSKYLDINQQEINIILKTYTDADILELAYELGKDDKEIKSYLKSFQDSKAGI